MNRSCPSTDQSAPVPSGSTGSHCQRGVSLISLLVSILIVAGLYLGYAWYSAKDVKMSERPEQVASTEPLVPRESSVVASIFVSHATLQTALNGIAQELKGTETGDEDIECVNVFGSRQCLTAKWNVPYSAGTISVTKAGDLVKVSLPVSFTGNVGLGGDIARSLGLHNKSIDGSANVSASLSADLDERFCPILTVKETEFSWVSEARIEVVGRTTIAGFIHIGPLYLDMGRHFNGLIRESLQKAAQKSSRAIPCDPVRAEVARFWQRYSIPLTTEGRPTLYVNAWPEKVGSSGILSEDTGIRIVLMMSGKATVETSPGATTPLGDIPAHVKLQAQPGHLSLAVPVRIDYVKLREALTTVLSSQAFEQDGTGGKVSVTLHEFEIFPSGKRVAVGVRFQADTQTGIFDTEGTVWLVAKPEVGADGKTVRLTEIEIYRKIDNEVVKVLTAVFEQQITKAIADAVHYDLRKDEQTLIASLQNAVTDPTITGGVQLTITDPSIQFGRIAVEDSALTVEGLFNAIWNAEVQELKL